MKSPMDHLGSSGSSNEHSFFVTPAIQMEVSNIINLLKTGKSVGPNSVSTKLLEILSPNISTPLSLSQIINESFQSGTFPTKMQLAKVIPLFKKGCPLNSSNFRPKSLLSVFSNITEKIVYKRLYHFLEPHNVLYSLQFGFRACHSINRALIRG